MSAEPQMYAEPVPPFALNEADLAKLRQRLAEAEKAVETEKDWTWRTRAQQDAIILRRQLESAELDAVRKQRHESRHERIAEQRIAEQAAQRRVADGSRLAVMCWMPGELGTK